MTVYLDGSKVEFDLESFLSRDERAFADDFRDRLETTTGKSPGRGPYPGVPPSLLIEHWATAEHEIVEHYLRGRLLHMDRGNGSPPPSSPSR